MLLISTLISRLMGSKDIDNSRSLRASINILLEQTKGNLDLDFPFMNLTRINWAKANSNSEIKETVEIFGKVFCRLEPSSLITNLQVDVSLMFAPEKTLYRYLLENEPGTAPIIQAIHTVLGENGIQQGLNSTSPTVPLLMLRHSHQADHEAIEGLLDDDLQEIVSATIRPPSPELKRVLF